MGTENCLWELAGVGSATSMSSSRVRVHTSETGRTSGEALETFLWSGALELMALRFCSVVLT